MNRAERRAIAQGNGRTKPMIEITDVESSENYMWELRCWDIAQSILQNNCRMFICLQLDYNDIRDEFSDDPCLYY